MCILSKKYWRGLGMGQCVILSLRHIGLELKRIPLSLSDFFSLNNLTKNVLPCLFCLIMCLYTKNYHARD